MHNRITSPKAYTDQIGFLVSEMTIVRNKTLGLTRNLCVQELDFNFDTQSNSIGTLLLHIAALEFKFQLDHFFKRNFTTSELEKYIAAAPFNMHKRLVCGNSYEFYASTLKEIRSQTLEQLKMKKDDWIHEDVFTSDSKSLGNRFYLLKHIIHDELCHQGQIKLILKRLKR